MEVRVETILDYLDITGVDYKYIGNKNISINKFSSINNLQSNCISWFQNKEIINHCDLSNIKDVLILVPDSMNIVNVSNRINFIACRDPKLNFFSIVNEFFKSEDYLRSISKNSTINSSNVDKNISIGAYCYIGSDVILEDGVIIKNNISIEGRVFIGKNSVINSGTIIGKDSYNYLSDSDGKKIKIPRYGGVYIGENVEIGANTVVERGTVDDTRILNNSKVGNSCIISADSLINENEVIEDNTRV